MIKKETYIFSIVLSVLVLLAFSLLYFLIPFPIKDNAGYVVNYVMTVVCLLAFAGGFLFGISKKKPTDGLLWRLPIVKLTVVFEIINLIFCGLLLAIDCFVSLFFYIPLIVFLFELIGYFFLYLVKKMNVYHIEENEKNIKDSTHNIKELRTKSVCLLSMCNDDVSRKNVGIIVDKLKYSDPMSNDDTKELEDNIFNSLSSLESSIASGIVVSSVDEIVSLIESRNAICRGNK